MAPTRRWAAAVGVVLALLTVAGPASAKSTAKGQNVTAQQVGVAKWQVVIIEGTTPATAPAPPPTFSSLGLTYLTLTNIGTVTPGTMTVTTNAGLTLLGNVELCRVPWTPVLLSSTCSQPLTYTSNVFVAGTANAPPAKNETWYVRVGGVNGNVTMSALATAPAGKSLNS